MWTAKIVKFLNSTMGRCISIGFSILNKIDFIQLCLFQPFRFRNFTLKSCIPQIVNFQEKKYLR